MGINGGRGFNECGARWRNYWAERMFALIERGGEGCVMALIQFSLSLSLFFGVAVFV